MLSKIRNPKLVSAPGGVSRVLFPLRGGDHSSRTRISPRLKQPTREHRTGHPQALLYLVLLRAGLAWPARSPGPPVSSYLTVSPLPLPHWESGGLLSVALSVNLTSRRGPLGVTQRPALRSSDFPPGPLGPGGRLHPRRAPQKFIIVEDGQECPSS